MSDDNIQELKDENQRLRLLLVKYNQQEQENLQYQQQFDFDAKYHDWYKCLQQLYRQSQVYNYQIDVPLSNCRLCDRQFELYCLDTDGTIKSRIRDLIMNYEGVIDIEIGQSKLRCGGYDHRRLLRPILNHGIQSKFLNEYILSNDSQLCQYIQCKWINCDD